MGYRKWLAGGMAGLGLLVSLPAMGDEIRITPMISVREDYNDNIFYDTADAQQDFITLISPGLILQRNTERLKTGLIARVDQRLYADNQDLDATDQFYQGNIRYALSPVIGIGARAAFTQDSSPDRDLETTGIVLNNDRRNRQEYAASGDYAFTEKTSGGLSYLYYRDKYSGSEDAELDDVEAHSGNLLFTHNLSTVLPETLGRLNFGFADYSFTDFTTQNYTTTVGFSRNISEIWRITVDLGARYTTSESDVGQEYSGYGGVGSAVISYIGEISNLDFFMNHDIKPATGRDGASNRTALGIRMNRRFAYEFSGFLSGGYILNDFSQGEYSTNNTSDQQTIYINPGIRYDITRDIAVEASYTYTWTEYDDATNSTAGRNLVMVRLYLQYPILE